jgi:hypothetical protein
MAAACRPGAVRPPFPPTGRPTAAEALRTQSEDCAWLTQRGVTWPVADLSRLVSPSRSVGRAPPKRPCRRQPRTIVPTTTAPCEGILEGSQWPPDCQAEGGPRPRCFAERTSPPQGEHRQETPPLATDGQTPPGITRFHDPRTDPVRIMVRGPPRTSGKGLSPAIFSSCLVELRRFELLTPSMRTRCATRLRHSPNSGKR